MSEKNFGKCLVSQMNLYMALGLLADFYLIGIWLCSRVNIRPQNGDRASLSI